jgi:hypothetical protein
MGAFLKRADFIIALCNGQAFFAGQSHLIGNGKDFEERIFPPTGLQLPGVDTIFGSFS